MKSSLRLLFTSIIFYVSQAWTIGISPPVTNNRIKTALYLQEIEDIRDIEDLKKKPKLKKLTISSDTNNEVLQLPSDDNIWKTSGEKIIMKAIIENGGKLEDVDIQWKPGRIIVTISGNSILSADETEEDDDIEIDEDEIDQRTLQEFDEEFNDESEDEIDDKSDNPVSVDVVSIAKAINIAFGEEGENSVGYNIAVHHSIEVTTPGGSDELYGIMFQSYKGFDVIVEAIDPKNKKKDGKPKMIIIEGSLVERNEKQTILNVKGRLKKLKNELVIRVKLPKAKKEKGAR